MRYSVRLHVDVDIEIEVDAENADEAEMVVANTDIKQLVSHAYHSHYGGYETRELPNALSLQDEPQARTDP